VTPDELAQGDATSHLIHPIINIQSKEILMDYKTALAITRAFDKSDTIKGYEKTEGEMSSYGEACQFLKSLKKAS
jgi:hypothetical protein